MTVLFLELSELVDVFEHSYIDNFHGRVIYSRCDEISFVTNSTLQKRCVYE